MPEQLDDTAVAHALLALAADLAMPDVDDFTAHVLAQLPTSAASRKPSHSRRRRWSIAVAAVLAATSATTLAIPDARAAVADWLGLDGVRIVRVDQLPATSSTTPSPTSSSPIGSGPTTTGFADTSVLSMLGLLPEMSLDQAGARIGVPVRRPTLAGLAPADLVGTGFSGRPVQLAQVWRAGGSLQPSGGLPEVAIVFAQLKVGNITDGGFQKTLPRGATIEQVTVNGRPAWWISGDMHELSFLTADGKYITDSTRLAGNTLLWAVDGVTYRLESSLGKVQAIAFAESVR